MCLRCALLGRGSASKYARKASSCTGVNLGERGLLRVRADAAEPAAEPEPGELPLARSPELPDGVAEADRACRGLLGVCGLRCGVRGLGTAGDLGLGAPARGLADTGVVRVLGGVSRAMPDNVGVLELELALAGVVASDWLAGVDEDAGPGRSGVTGATATATAAAGDTVLTGGGTAAARSSVGRVFGRPPSTLLGRLTAKSLLVAGSTSDHVKMRRSAMVVARDLAALVTEALARGRAAPCRCRTGRRQPRSAIAGAVCGRVVRKRSHRM